MNEIDLSKISSLVYALGKRTKQGHYNITLGDYPLIEVGELTPEELHTVGTSAMASSTQALRITHPAIGTYLITPSESYNNGPFGWLWMKNRNNSLRVMGDCIHILRHLQKCRRKPSETALLSLRSLAGYGFTIYQ